MEESTARRDGVQSLGRALDIVEAVLAGSGRMAIGEIAEATGLPLPTIHRLLRTLVDRGYVRRLPDRRYAIGFRFVPLGDVAVRLVGATSMAVLDGLVASLRETANLAVLSGDRAEYLAQVPSPHPMRMFTEVGHRAALHSTGVGKALLSELTDAEVHEIVARTGLPPATEHTITSEPALFSALADIRRDGVVIDDEEQELGVRCVAVPVRSALPIRMAVSISGPAVRVDAALIERAIPLLSAAADRLAASMP
jgi:IclR family acetate operon transcriptional repressor